MIQKLLTSLRLILITLAIYLAVDAFYKLITARLDIDTPPASVTKAIAVPQDISHPPFTHYRPIVDRNLFQTRSKSLKSGIPKASVQLDNLEETKLKLKLWGTVTGSKEQAYAVIEEEKSREQNLFNIGDTIQNATVKMILRNKVILSVRGKDEILEMEKTDRPGSRDRSSSRIAARRSRTFNRLTPKRRIRLSRS